MECAIPAGRRYPERASKPAADVRPGGVRDGYGDALHVDFPVCGSKRRSFASRSPRLILHEACPRHLRSFDGRISCVYGECLHVPHGRDACEAGYRPAEVRIRTRADPCAGVRQILERTPTRLASTADPGRDTEPVVLAIDDPVPRTEVCATDRLPFVSTVPQTKLVI